jgi:PAP2 superfamily/CARDB
MLDSKVNERLSLNSSNLLEPLQNFSSNQVDNSSGLFSGIFSSQKMSKSSFSNEELSSPNSKPTDLAVSLSIVETPTIFPNEVGKIKVEVRNNGEAKYKGPLDLNIYASTDSVLNLPINNGNLAGKDELLGNLQRSFINISPGKSKEFTINFANPEFRTASVVAPGAYFLIAEVTTGKQVSEVNKSNNLSSAFVSTDGTDVVTDWNAVALNAIQATQTPTLLASRSLAIVQTAVFDAINAITKKYSPYHFKPELSEVEGASVEAAVVGAAYEALINLFPSQTSVLNEMRNFSLAEIPDGVAEQKGLTLGERAASYILSLRINDGSDKAENPPYNVSPQPGIWRPTAPNFSAAVFPQWGKVKPFAVENIAAFSPDGFPTLDSQEYAQEFNQVKDLGAKNSSSRTDDQTEIAKFWSFGRSDTFTTPGQWNRIAQQVAIEKHFSLEDNARMFALLNIAQFDAGIGAYNAKYTFNRWRPITAIREADTDGNSQTGADPNWESLLNTPAHPDYLAAHSVFGGAAGKVLSYIYGDDTSFNITSQELPGVSRSYQSFTQAAAESGMSRIYGGVHFQSANIDGLATGNAIANDVLSKFFT